LYPPPTAIGKKPAGMVGLSVNEGVTVSATGDSPGLFGVSVGLGAAGGVSAGAKRQAAKRNAAAKNGGTLFFCFNVSSHAKCFIPLLIG
jgi:hypothetical protein